MAAWLGVLGELGEQGVRWIDDGWDARGRRGRRARAAVAILALFAGACTFDTPIPRERPAPPPAAAPREIRIIYLDEPVEAALDCAELDCNQWFRIDIHHYGRLEIDVDRLGSDGAPMMRVLVRELGRSVQAQTAGAPDELLEIRTRVRPGVYMILVQGGGSRQPYRLSVALADASPDRLVQ